MFTNNPYAQGGWHNPQNVLSINNAPWVPNAWHPPTFGALPASQTNSSILTFEFSSFQPDILNSVVTGPNNSEFFTVRTPTPGYTVIYKAGAPFATITWQHNPIVEAGGIITRQRASDFLKISPDNRYEISFLQYNCFANFFFSHRLMTVNYKTYAWIPRGRDVYVCPRVHHLVQFT